MLTKNGLLLALGLGSTPATVNLFWSTECPVAEASSSALNALVRRFADRPVSFQAFFSNEGETKLGVGRMMSRRNHKIPWQIDQNAVSARQFGIRRVPTVIVMDATGNLMFSGPLRDASDRNRPVAQEAIEATIAGKRPEVSFIEPTGCLLQLPVESLPNPGLEPMVSYGDVVQPMLRQWCVRCHEPNGVAPFSLDDYVSARRWAPMMVEVLRRGKMPADGLDIEESKSLESAIEVWLKHGRPGGTPASQNQLPLNLDQISLPTTVISPCPEGETITRRWIAKSHPGGTLAVKSKHPSNVRALDIFRPAKNGMIWVGHWTAGSSGWLSRITAGERLSLNWRFKNSLSANVDAPNLMIRRREVQAPQYFRTKVSEVEIVNEHMTDRIQLSFPLSMVGTMTGFRLIGKVLPMNAFVYYRDANMKERLLGEVFPRGANWPLVHASPCQIVPGGSLIVRFVAMKSPNQLHWNQVALEAAVVPGPKSIISPPDMQDVLNEFPAK